MTGSAILIVFGFAQMAIVGVRIILTYIISIIGYYIVINFNLLSWVVNDYGKSSLESAFLGAGPTKNRIRRFD